MRILRRRRLLTNISLVLLVLGLARVAGLSGDTVVAAALIIAVLMGLETLAFAEPGQPRGVVSRRRSRRVHSVRAIGFAVVALLAVASYVLQRMFILNDWRMHANLLWLLLPLCFSALVDAQCSRPYVDEYWMLGKAVASGRWKPTAPAKRDFGSCFIKVFFYPMMFVYTEQYLDLFANYWFPESWTAGGIYHSLAIYSLLVDLIFGASGYALSLKILGNRVRSINPYPAGWLVTIICYSPFWDMIGRVVIFQWHADWIGWTKDHPVVQFVWLTMIACCFVVYAWATVELGPKFSNLSYRGTVDSGPYRLMKHPAYVSKIVSYWLITVPFVPIYGWVFAFQQCFALSLASAIYYLRAKYEEKHLLRHPEYKAYASSPIKRHPEICIVAS